MKEIFMKLLGLIFGGSTTSIVIIVLAIAGLAVYGINTINDLQSKLTIAQTNYETAHQNSLELQSSLDNQVKEVKRLEGLLKLSNSISQDLVKGINNRSQELNTLRKKINVLLTKKVQKEILAKPTEYESKINSTMLAINKCFEELSKEDFNRQEENNDEIHSKDCSIEPIADFTTDRVQ
jgi:hypothetical protein